MYPVYITPSSRTMPDQTPIYNQNTWLIYKCGVSECTYRRRFIMENTHEIADIYNAVY